MQHTCLRGSISVPLVHYITWGDACTCAHRRIFYTPRFRPVRNKASIVPLEIPVDCTFEQLGDIIFSSTPIDKRKLNLVLKCKYPLKCGNRFQPLTIWNDSSVHLMLNMVNTTVIEEIELFVEVVRIHRQENQSIGVA